MARIPFNRAYTTGAEHRHIAEAIGNAHLSCDGDFTRRTSEWLEAHTATRRALLTHSCTAALEMAAILSDTKAGDEIIMPSFTFVSTANAFVLRGGVPVFVDIRPDTLNIDEGLIEAAITERTTAIAPVHYAGVGCDMDAILAIAERHGLMVIEDAAQCLLARYRGRELGTFGALGTLSFHETKNVTCGEGGALLVNDKDLVERAEIIREKGTNRSRFFRGEVDKYTWVDIGSSHGLSDLSAAFLYGQLAEAQAITERRLAIWNRYHDAFAGVERLGLARRPIVPDECEHNGHLYYLLLPTAATRDEMLRRLHAEDVYAFFHYIPLHSSPAGLAMSRTVGDLTLTDDLSARLLRLPLWPGMERSDVDRVVEVVLDALPDVVEVPEVRSRGRWVRHAGSSTPIR
jgi:dTDP-4-amino-4,6-dideoxygalactose transaminase